MPIVLSVHSIFGISDQALFPVQHMFQRPLTLDASPEKRQDMPTIVIGMMVPVGGCSFEQLFPVCSSLRLDIGLASGIMERSFGSSLGRDV